MTKTKYYHIIWKIERPKNEDQEIKLQIKMTKIVSELFGAHVVPFSNPRTAHRSGVYTVIDSDNLIVFTINVYVPTNKKTKEEINELVELCSKKLNSLRSAKHVICYRVN